MLERRIYLGQKIMKAIHGFHVKNGTPPLAVFNFDLVGLSIYTRGFYEHPELECIREYILPKLPKKSLMLDIGANVGNHSVFFSSHFDQVKSFEPNPRTAKLLEANAMLFANIEVFNYGLSSKETILQAGFDYENVGAASVSRSKTAKNVVEFVLKRLDDQLCPEQCSKVSLIKIDVEGHELDALKGASKTIENSSPVILFEANETEIIDGSTDAKRYLEEIGYDFFYCLKDTAPYSAVSPRLAKAINALSVLFFSKKLLNKYIPSRITGPLDRQNYKMLIASKYDLEQAQ